MNVVCSCLLVAAKAGPADPLLPLWAMEWLAAGFLYVWLFWLGATVGSFLNVVVYRLPRGRNLAFPGSACPRCGHPIRLQDNIPILSWLALGGRCRDCGGPISPRYFGVELLTATMFLLVLVAEYYVPAVCLAEHCRPPLTRYDIVPFWVRYALHVSLAATLLAAALIQSDGFRVPARVFGPIIVAGLALPLAWPEVRNLPAASDGPFGGWQVGLLDGLAGLVVGGLLGAVVGLVGTYWRGQWPHAAPTAMLASVCVVFGWQLGLLMSPVIWLGSAACVRAVRFLSGTQSQPQFAEQPADPGERPASLEDHKTE